MVRVEKNSNKSVLVNLSWLLIYKYKKPALLGFSLTHKTTNNTLINFLYTQCSCRQHVNVDILYLDEQ